MTKYWVSCPKFTGQVNVENAEGVLDGGIDLNATIIDTPPVWKKFKGQTLHSLLHWLSRFGRVNTKELNATN